MHSLQVDNRSADYDPHHPGTVRREGSFIYEEFLVTGGTDVKVYTVRLFLYSFPFALDRIFLFAFLTIYEEFLVRGGTDVKVYMVGNLFFNGS